MSIPIQAGKLPVLVMKYKNTAFLLQAINSTKRPAKISRAIDVTHIAQLWAWRAGFTDRNAPRFISATPPIEAAAPASQLDLGPIRAG
jgi:hypothetical protein